ncbi:MAG: transposase [Methylococcales bacterium]|nr:transposase [Methylococcales bacterium]
MYWLQYYFQTVSKERVRYCRLAQIPAFLKVAKYGPSTWVGLVHFVTLRITNGILEGINSKIQLAKRRAGGYRNINNFINMIYFVCGKLKFDYPLYFT